MKINLLLVSLILASSLAFACPPTPPKPTPPTPPSTTITVDPSINNTNQNVSNNTNLNANTNNTTVKTDVANTNNNTVKSDNTNTMKDTNIAAANQDQTQKQNQHQSQTAKGGAADSTSVAQSTSAATNNGNGSNNTTTNVAAPKIPVNTAYAPSAFPTVPCFKGYGGGVQVAQAGVSFGGGKIDGNCAILETARSFGVAGSWLAYCKVMLTDKYVKAAGVTLQDCLDRYVPTVPEPVAVIPPAPQVSILPIEIPVVKTELVVMPMPVVTAPVPIQVPVSAPVVKKRVVHHLPPDCQNVMMVVCVKPEPKK